MLTITKSELTRRIRRHIGFDQSAVLSTDEENAVSDAILMGLRWFYFGSGHDWSFLRKFHTEALESTNTSFVLPSDFVRVSSSVTAQGLNRPLANVTSSQLQNYVRNEQAPGSPAVYAVETDLPATEQYTLTVYPAPAAGLTLNFWYLFDPGVPTDSVAPRGGAQHAECIVAACLAAIEQIVQPENETAAAALANYEAKVAAAIEIDKRIGGVA